MDRLAVPPLIPRFARDKLKNVDETPRNLRERTGKHKCIRCLAEVPDDVYFANDQVCDECADRFEKELTVEKQADDR